MTGSKLHPVIVAVASLAAGCTAGADAQDVSVKTAPADAPITPVAPRPAADDSMRALAEEVARLRAQLADLRNAQTPAAREVAVQQEPAADAQPAAPGPQPDGRIAMGEDADAPATTVIERET